VTVGPVVDGDVDHETARRFGAQVVTVPPFAPPAEAVDRAQELVKAADAVVIASEAAELGANPELQRAATNVLVVGDQGRGRESLPTGWFPRSRRSTTLATSSRWQTAATTRGDAATSPMSVGLRGGGMIRAVALSVLVFASLVAGPAAAAVPAAGDSLDAPAVEQFRTADTQSADARSATTRPSRSRYDSTGHRTNPVR